jgi:hypothetical protein
MEIEEKYKIVQDLWDKHMFISESSKTESAEDSNIPFSAHDTKNIRTWKYKYKPDEVLISYNRVSHVFQWANEILEEWGYECIEKNKIINRRGFLDNYYSWGSPNILCLATIIVHNNFCHRELFKFYATGYDSCVCDKQVPICVGI